MARKGQFKSADAAPVHEISPERWRELYWSAESGYPSAAMLARRFGVSEQTICRCLQRAGIQRRSGAEQKAIDTRAGRNLMPVNPGRKDIHLEAGKWIAGLGPRQRRQMTEKACAVFSELTRLARCSVPCSWCGNPVDLKPSLAHGRRYCSTSHRSLAYQFRRQYGDSPRPLIVARLRELNAGWPNTYERLEKVGEQIGAREPEILEVMLEETENA